MPDDYKVKGSSITSKLQFVRETFGSRAERELKEQFADRGELAYLLDSSMYPFELYDEINRAIADRHYGGDVRKLAEVGSFSAEQVLTSIYRAFAEGKDFVRFLERAALLHSRFYSHGEMNVEIAEDRKSAVVRLSGAPTYSEADLHIAGGFYRGAAKLLGLEDMSYSLELGEDGARFDLAWG